MPAIKISEADAACANMVNGGECTRGDQICEDNGLYCPEAIAKTIGFDVEEDTPVLEREVTRIEKALSTPTDVGLEAPC